MPDAGWYPDPQGPGMLRYWDGRAWTGHQVPRSEQSAQPGGPPSAPTSSSPSSPDSPSSLDSPTETATPSSTYAWLLAATPIILLAVNAVLALLIPGDTPGVGSSVALGLVIGLVFADSQVLERAGVRVSKWWGVLLLPVYLILRTKRARSTAAIPLTWFGLVLGSLVVSLALPPVLDDAAPATAGRTAGDVPAPAPSAGPTAGPTDGTDPAGSSEAEPTPAPFTPTASVNQVGGADVRIECWVGTPYGDDYDFVGHILPEIWPAMSPDCSPTETSGNPSAKERKALRKAYPGGPVDVTALAPLYAICAENDEQWLDELYYQPTAELAQMTRGALVLCPRHPQRDKADWLLENLDLSGESA